MHKMLFFLTSFLPGKQRIGIARQHPLQELPLGIYLAFRARLDVAHLDNDN